MNDPLHTKVCDMFGNEFPIFAFTHCKDVAAAVTNAGGVGVLGELSHSPEEIKADIRWMRERVGNKPFGIDLVFPASIPEKNTSREGLEAMVPEEHRAFLKSWMEKHGLQPMPVRRDNNEFAGGLFSKENAMAQLQMVLDERVPLIAAGLGSPAFVLDAAHERGVKVAGLIGKVRQARREIEAGVDIIIAQGYDGGGHTGDIGTFTLVPRVVEIAGDTPVLCAGGVGTGRHLAAALAFGAAGVWSGTLWLASRESDADILVKEKIVASTEEDTVRSRALTGKPARQLKNAWNMAWEEPDAPKTLPMPLQFLLSGPAGAAMAVRKEAPYVGSPAGMAIGTINEVKSCGEIIFDMVSEARDVLDGFAGVTA